jgi:hypothetical protein
MPSEPLHADSPLTAAPSQRRCGRRHALALRREEVGGAVRARCCGTAPRAAASDPSEAGVIKNSSNSSLRARNSLRAPES